LFLVLFFLELGQMTVNEQNRIYIFDTTLRDGQQCPGAGMSFEDNLAYARLAALVGVDVLEAGFPSASKLDFEIVKAIATELEKDGPIIAGLCQLRDEQIDITIESLLPATVKNKARLHVYVPVDPELMRASLGDKANKSKIVEDVGAFVARAVKAGLEVEFSPEGYSRMGENFDFVTDCIRAAVSSGALVINCPDTIGGASRLQGEDYFVNKMQRHAGIIAEEFPGRTVIWSMHCHNDFGMALENSLNGVFFGPARQIEGCFNGIGERAGNVALEQVIMAIKHFAGPGSKPLWTGARTENLKRISDFVAAHMLPRQPHTPITGDNAARHSSGRHTNAILKNPLAYQPFDPGEVGSEISIVFGPLSGGNHAKSIIEKNGYRCSDSEKAEVAQFIKSMFKDRRKGITDSELILGYFAYRSPIRVESFDYSRSSNRSSIKLFGTFFDESGEIEETHEGKDSALAALKKAIDRRLPGYEILSYRSSSDGEGINARSISTITVVDEEKRTFEGIGSDEDIEISAMKALIAAVNRAYVESNYRI
jgi:2-isopropylmalate synthase